MLQVRHRVEAGAVVDDQELAAKPGRDGFYECIDARLRVPELVMTRDDDRDRGRVLENGGRRAQTRRCAVVRHLEHRVPSDAGRLGKSRFGGRHHRDHVDASVQVGEFRLVEREHVVSRRLFPERKPAVPIKDRGFAARLSFDPFREIRELSTPALARVGRVERKAGSKLL